MRAIALCLVVVGSAACAGYVAAEAGGSIAASALSLLAGVALFFWAEQWLLGLIGATPLPRDTAAHVSPLLQHLAPHSGLPAPALYLLRDDTPNMLVAGRRGGRASIVLTAGLIGVLDRDELAAMLALALAQIGGRHLWAGTVAATCAGYLAQLAKSLPQRWQRPPEAGRVATAKRWLNAALVAILASIAAGVIRVLAPTGRDFCADAEASAMIGDPLPLARALEKLAAGNRTPVEPGLNPGVAHQLAVAPYMEGALTSLCAGRPAVARRVARLREQALHPLPEQSWDLIVNR